MDDLSPVENDELSDYDIYSKTPPRTKILRKNRERKQKEKQSFGNMMTPKGHKSKTPLNRRNTESAMYDELIAKADHPDNDQGPKRSSKRSMKLLRESERDLKLDISSAQEVGNRSSFPSYQIESCKKFMSLSCRTRTVDSESRKNQHENGTRSKRTISFNEDEEDIQEVEVKEKECPQARVEFYKTLSLLIRMGGNDKAIQERNPRRALSKEETYWQNELKDLIWLELQAYHADLSPMEEDAYLCVARESVEPLLEEIMQYKFTRHPKPYSTQSSDSGVEEDCTGCVSIYCSSCMEAQNEALREIERLMKRLEDAESLFPSGKAFAELFPLYSSPQFVGRVKAISLWYNMTKHQRLKLSILGRLLTLLDTRQNQWPMLTDDTTSDSPSDSNNSTNGESSNDFSYEKACGFNIAPIAACMSKKDENSISPYRRYIENMLKTRALHKSLNFLERLHASVLRKTQLTLEKPISEDIFLENTCGSEDEELRRYGCWSPEAKALNLPSYRSMFIFLSAVPLEVINEYLLMRLEQKPENPSPLSVRQLMRELKEGLHIASRERERIVQYIATAVAGTTENIDRYKERLNTFDERMLKVFQDYLDYLEQWALLHHDTFQKNLLEEEYQFCCKIIINKLPGGAEILGSKFSYILGTILKRIGERMVIRIDDLLTALPKEEDSMIKQDLFSICRELQSLFNEEREMSIKTMAFCKTILKFKTLPWNCKKDLIDSIILFKCLIPETIGRVQNLFDITNIGSLDEMDKASLNSRIREILMQVYRFGFEFYRELSDLIPPHKRRVSKAMVQFAYLWMQFVTERCERGRGMRPRWAYQGLEFLLTVCEPCHTKFLTDEEFEDLKTNMDVCISHVIGTTAPSTPDSGVFLTSSRNSLDQIRNARSRGSSPSPRPTYKSQRSNASNGSRKTSMENQNNNSEVDNVNSNSSNYGSLKRNDAYRIKLPPKTYAEHVKEAIEALETELDLKLRQQHLIGKVLNCDTNATNKTQIRRRNVTFSWQRGIKIGQGRFGKVYTAVNNNTGEMMAVKEIALQHNDRLTIKRIAEEMKILEGIVHKNLVRYYGIEVHRDEMLIFMEFCAEGTLEQLVDSTENGLPELIVRRYTFQLVSGVAVLHDHGIVHRDIKTANIFLTNEGNCLKIGDFGCAAKIKSTTTMPGELKGFVGTQAYMAPEVFTKNMSEGHGRAADIWSVGCVVVEMASGKRPWAQFDSNYQIMFKVGMGQSPDPPDDMIDEGLDFLDLCFKHDPKQRATAHELLAHNFVKVGDDEEKYKYNHTPFLSNKNVGLLIGST